MRKIRILMVLGNTGMGGTQAFIINLLRNIDRNKFHFDLAVNNEKATGIGEEITSLGGDIFILPYFKIYNRSVFVRAWRSFFETHSYDIVHAHSTNSASIYLKIAKEYGCVTIAHSHSAGYRGNVIERIVKRVYAHKTRKYADYWFACSDRAAMRLFGNDFRLYQNYFEIPNAIEVEKYVFDKYLRDRIRDRLGVDSHVFLCGHVGTFSGPKNHAFLLDVFNEVLKIRPNARLVCCGAGPLEFRIKDKARLLGIADKIFYTGVVNNINEHLMAMDVLVFPSLFEGFGIAVLEAEATGLPVVMSDVIPSDVDLTNLIYRLSLSNPASKWAEVICGINKKDRVAYNKTICDSKYNINNCVKLLTSLYEKMVED